MSNLQLKTQNWKINLKKVGAHHDTPASWHKLPNGRFMNRPYKSNNIFLNFCISIRQLVEKSFLFRRIILVLNHARDGSCYSRISL